MERYKAYRIAESSDNGKLMRETYHAHRFGLETELILLFLFGNGNQDLLLPHSGNRCVYIAKKSNKNEVHGKNVAHLLVFQ